MPTTEQGLSRSWTFPPDFPWEAGEGNRTLVIGLEDRCSTIELHPRKNHPGCTGQFFRRRFRGCFSPRLIRLEGKSAPNGQSRIRTCVGLSPPDLQSGAIGRSAICPSLFKCPAGAPPGKKRVWVLPITTAVRSTLVGSRLAHLVRGHLPAGS